MAEPHLFHLENGHKIEVSVVPAIDGDGYAIIHKPVASEGPLGNLGHMDCYCADGTSDSKDCPTPYNNTCSCWGPATVICG